MRRRLIITALVLDGLCALAGVIVAPSVMAAPAEATEAVEVAPDYDRYVEVDGYCLERDQASEVGTGGWIVDSALCSQG